MKRRAKKKQAAREGVSTSELEMLEMLEEMVERVAMLEYLCFANNFLITDRTAITEEEKDRIFRAAVRAVDPDSPVAAWRERIGRIKGEVLDKKRAIRRERKKEKLGKAEPLPGEEGAGEQ